jgi:hypothetical protein
MKKIDIEHRWQVGMARYDRLSIQADKRSIVLMNALYSHSIKRRTSGLSKRLAPLAMSIIEQPCPVNRADDQRITCPEQDETNGF